MLQIEPNAQNCDTCDRYFDKLCAHVFLYLRCNTCENTYIFLYARSIEKYCHICHKKTKKAKTLNFRPNSVTVSISNTVTILSQYCHTYSFLSLWTLARENFAPFGVVKPPSLRVFAIASSVMFFSSSMLQSVHAVRFA